MTSVQQRVMQGWGSSAADTRATGRLRWLAIAAVAALAPLVSQAQEQPAESRRSGCKLTGHVRASGRPLPGVALVLSSPSGAALAASSTAMDGAYVLSPPAPGAYVLQAGLAGFADVSREVALAAESCEGTEDIEMVLRSRVAPVVVPRPGPTPAPTSPVPGRPSGAANDRRDAARGGRFRDLGVLAGAVAGTPTESTAEGTDPSLQSLLPPGFSADAPTEAVAMRGGQAQTLDGVLFRDRLTMLDEAGGDLDGLAQRMRQAFAGGGMGPGPDFPGGGPGGPGFGGGEFRGGPGAGLGGGAFRGGAGGVGRADRLQGSIFYSLGDSAFDASPYALRGSRQKAGYAQQRFGATIGGPVKIPGVYDGASRTSFVLSYTGNHSRSPQDSYSTVPTEDERAGDLSALDTTIVDPATGAPFNGSVIPDERIDPAARALLGFIPLPNQPGATQNYHYVTTTTDSSDQLSFRLVHSFGRASRAVGVAGGAARRASGGRGARERRPTISIGVTYRASTRDDTGSFPTLGGSTHTRSWDVPVSLAFTKWRVFHQLRLDYNRNQSDSRNLYAYSRNVAQEAGIGGVSSDPFDWGVPDLSFTSIAGLHDQSPASRLNQRIALGDTMTATVGQHTLRWGGEYRDLRLDSQSDANARGNFVFTGLYTAALSDGRPLPDTGLDFADFLLGLPQQASVRYGPGRVRFRGHSWSGFVQDDWRLRGNLTLNLGLRYEYVSPFTEASGHLVDLDVNPAFTAAAPVLAGQVGPYSGAFPTSLLYGDYNNVAPRAGVAWKPNAGTTVRVGYGVHYNLGAYAAIAQNLAGQPPFAVSDTSLGSLAAPLSLSNAFQPVDKATTTNSYGIDKHYQLGCVQVWNLDWQREVARVWIFSIGYTGAKGSDLDLERAPNRGPAGLRIPGVQPFLWQTSDSSSIMHSLMLRVRRRMARGISFGASYTFGKSLDDASSIGGAPLVVAQNDLDLAAERGRSSFDRRHRFNADYAVELPFGPGRLWIEKGFWAALLGGWTWNGNATIQSGPPFTARVVGAFADVARGVNGTLRANATGAPIDLPDPTPAQWFNTGAFAMPATGSFGDAGRNTITGPGSFLVNMSLSKNVSLAARRTLTLRIQANNLFNTPQFNAIDTVVNSPTFGQVVTVGPMRTLQLQARLRL